MKKRIVISAFYLLSVCIAVAAQQRATVFSFGLIADTHICDKPDQATVIAVTAAPRYFTGGLPKIEAFAGKMNEAGAAFVAVLGDYTDSPLGADAMTPLRPPPARFL